jgi:ethanolamine utilization protein EutQ (cupin superfamily)
MQQPVTTNNRSVQKFTIETARDWMEWEGISLSDVVNEDETPDMKLGAVGFTRAPKGASSSFEFAYDEVLIITSGVCTVRTAAGSITVKAGEIIYLPAGVQGTFLADEDTTHVYVASSPYGEVNRETKAALLNEKTR